MTQEHRRAQQHRRAQESPGRVRAGRRGRELAVRVLVAAALAVDAYVHLDLAPAMQLAAPGGVGGGTLFRIQAGAAVVAALFLLVTGSRLGYALAALVALSALVPVLLYSLVNVPALGPIPSLYDPTWYPAKVASVVAETVAVVLAVLGMVWTGRGPPARLRDA